MISKKKTNFDLPQGCEKCELTSNPKILNLQRKKKLRLALVGQPNSGKSTFFNSLSYYKVNTANYSGTTVEYHTTTIFVKDYEVELIDLPGIYSLNYNDLAEKIAFEVLVNGISKDLKIDGIIQVVETASLPHSLLLTLDLITLELPMVIALNMFDEARIKGIKIDIQTLQDILKIPVIPTVSIRGENTFKTVLKLVEMIDKKNNVNVVKNDSSQINHEFIQNISFEEKRQLFYKSTFSKDELLYVVDIYKNLWKKMVKDIFDNTGCHVENCKLVPACLMNIEKYAPNMKSLAGVRDELLKLKSNIITSISSVVFDFSKPFPTLDDILDKYVLNKFWGYLILFLVLITTFFLSYFVGNFIADNVEGITDGLSERIDNISNNLGVFKPLIVGFKEGIMGGIGIVIPYLLPFLFFIAFLEDSGYIPRMMYLINGLLRPFGITARSILGFVLGLGCNVSAIMSLRGLMNNRERILASMVIPFVACSARTVVIMALVVGYLGVFWGLFMYFLSFFVSFLALFLINKFSRFNNPNFVVPVPPYRLPSLKNIFTKIWLRFKAFVYSAWPVLILGTIIVNYLDYFNFDKYINSLFSFLTVDLLNLPIETGIPLIFGVLAKEYALVMLFSALGTENVKEIMTSLQIFTFSVFILLYTPCLSTISIQAREIGIKYTIYSILLTFSAAVIFSFGLSKLLGAFLR